MKKNHLLFMLLLVISGTAITGCFKNDVAPTCTGYTLAQDRHVIDSFLNSNGQTANYAFDTDHGWYYSVTNPGNGNAPAPDSLVAWSLSGKLLSQSEFATNAAANAVYTLSYYSQDAILGFSLPKLKEGGTMRLIIPSSLSYGCAGAKNTSGVQVIPPNSQVIYDITLTDVKKN